MKLSLDEIEILRKSIDILSKCTRSGIVDQGSFIVLEKYIKSVINENVENEKKLDGEEKFEGRKELNNKEYIDDIFETVPYADGIAISKYTGFDETDIYIPSCINGKKVLALEEKAFYKANHIVSVDMSEGIESIGDHCFDSCSKLERIHFPNTLKAIGEFAFARTALRRVNIPNNVFYMGGYTFLIRRLQKLCYLLHFIQYLITHLNYADILRRSFFLKA